MLHTSQKTESTTLLTPSESWADNENPRRSIQDEQSFVNQIQSTSSTDLSLVVHPLPERDGIIVSANPPKCPAQALKHVPCDLVLVIDVSGSMSTAAPVPSTNEGEAESSGLSVLDLTKHAARTILDTLDENDRLGLVTYSTEAKIIFELTSMSKDQKQLAVSKIEGLKVEGLTNMWHGILSGIKLFEKATKSKNVPAMMVLTDGMPNHMCPQQGYVPKLRTYDLPCTIHTFGFGYSIKSGLLKSIAEVGGGNYAFIPDAGMIGTVFVHAVANLQSTYATNATLTLTATCPLELAETTGVTVENGIPTKDSMQGSFCSTLTIPLGNIQYGQSRDIFLKYTFHGVTAESSHDPTNAAVYAAIVYSPTETGVAVNQFKTVKIEDVTEAPKAWCAYQRFRSSICATISSFFPILPTTGEHTPMGVQELEMAQKKLSHLVASMKAADLQDDLNQSLLEDLSGADPHGQISLAVSDGGYFSRWGQHYLLSILNAHAKQYCNTFKDPGPLMYGRDSPLFIKCRTELDNAFDNLPAPTPSIGGSRILSNHPGDIGQQRRFKMSLYNRSSNPCFAGFCKVRMADDKRRSLENLRPGDIVWTPKGARTVAAVIRTPLKEKTTLYKIGKLLVTPWHPIKIKAEGREEEAKWVFPCDHARNMTSYYGSIYSVMLEHDTNSDAHAIEVEGVTAVTLGHGIKADGGHGDARAHAFLGDWFRVKSALQKLSSDENGVLRSGGVGRSEKSGLVNEFVCSD